ncbi:sortase [Iamia majanohamensis]|uniref:Sortase n=1 Tax=Iamia majanohamensis TaxID=467976 RepID=A0AAF0BST1_9ACTN|nr:class F sortase [Iamia majanohamensis]WCO65752.1 sortase [Iamia majanohamensis]
MGDPARLVIEKIGVDTDFVPLELDDAGRLQAPETADVAGWHVGGPEPGEPGAAVVAGHYDSRTGPGVFYELGELEAGDEVVIGGEHGLAVFVVDRVETYSKEAVPAEVYTPTPEASLRLITCGGRFDQSSRHYEDNVVVWASLRGDI